MLGVTVVALVPDSYCCSRQRDMQRAPPARCDHGRLRVSRCRRRNRRHPRRDAAASADSVSHAIGGRRGLCLLQRHILRHDRPHFLQQVNAGFSSAAGPFRALTE